MKKLLCLTIILVMILSAAACGSLPQARYTEEQKEEMISSRRSIGINYAQNYEEIYILGTNGKFGVYKKVDTYVLGEMYEPKTGKFQFYEEFTLKGEDTKLKIRGVSRNYIVFTKPNNGEEVYVMCVRDSEFVSIEDGIIIGSITVSPADTIAEEERETVLDVFRFDKIKVQN